MGGDRPGGRLGELRDHRFKFPLRPRPQAGVRTQTAARRPTDLGWNRGLGAPPRLVTVGILAGRRGGAAGVTSLSAHRTCARTQKSR